MTELLLDEVVDAHLHLWDPSVLYYPWLDGLAINAPHRLADVPVEVEGARVSAAVFVQAECEPAQRRDEVTWVQNQMLSPGGAEIVGIVAGVDLLAATIETELASLAEEDRVVGIRQNIQGQPEGFALSLAEGIAVAASYGLTFDICCEAHQLPEVVRLVRGLPSDARLVLDHLGKPAVGDASLREAWHSSLDALASRPNVMCKLSGLLTETIDGVRPSFDTIAPYLADAIQAFGTDRVLFGSDWPVCTLAGTTAQWASMVAQTLGADRDAQQAVFHDNAIRFYRPTLTESTIDGARQ